MFCQIESSHTYFEDQLQSRGLFLIDVFSGTLCWVTKKVISDSSGKVNLEGVYAYYILSHCHFFPSWFINSVYRNPSWFLSITLTYRGPSKNLFSFALLKTIIIIFPHIILVSDNFLSSSFNIFSSQIHFSPLSLSAWVFSTFPS